MLHHCPQLQDTPHQKAWLAWGRQVGLLCPELEGWHIDHCFFSVAPVWYTSRETGDLSAEGNPSGRDIVVPGEPSSNFPHHAACWPARGARKRPVSSRPAPGGHLLLESLPTPATIQAYWVPALPGDPPFIFFCHGFWEGIASTSFSHAAGWHLEEAVDIQCQLQWWPQGWTPEKAVQCHHLPRLLAPPGEGYAQENGQGCLLAKPCSASGSASLIDSPAFLPAPWQTGTYAVYPHSVIPADCDN